MRRLAKLVDVPKGVSTCSELFVVDNFYLLEEGIQTMCVDNSHSGKPFKAHLKVAIWCLIRMCTKNLAADYIIQNQTEKNRTS